MLLSPLITSLDDQDVAARMREICARFGVGPSVTSIATSIALEAHQQGATLTEALRLGSAFVVRMRRSQARAHRVRRVSAAVAHISGQPAAYKRPEALALALGVLILAVSLSGIL